MNIHARWQRAHGPSLGQARLKVEIDDFIVDEDLGFAPDGEGEHLLIQVEKTGMSSFALIDALAQRCQVPVQSIGYAGLKDRWARTRQWLSIHLPGRDAPEELDGEGWRVLARHRHLRKLPRGSHRANRFRIRLRDVDLDELQLQARLQSLRDLGVPNYFGEQRFGRERQNIELGLAMLGRWQRLRTRRLPRREAMWLSALRSAWFNKVLSARVAQGSWNQCLDGDVLMLDGRQSFFHPQAEDAAIVARLAALDVHPSGPLPGRGKPVVNAQVAALEAAVLAEDSEAIAVVAQLLEHDRRALRLRVQNLQHERCGDDLCLSFELGRGAYATVVLQEIVDLVEGDHHGQEEGGE